MLEPHDLYTSSNAVPVTTPLGTTLHETIQALVTWTEQHQEEVAAARAGYDARVGDESGDAEPARSRAPV